MICGSTPVLSTLVRQVPGVRRLIRPVKDQRYLLRSAHVEVVADELLEKRAPRRRTIKHPGIRDLKLAKRQLVDVARAQVLGCPRAGQPLLPTPKEALHRARAESVADPRQHLGVIAAAEPVVQRGVADAEPSALPLRPGVPVEPDPHRPGSVGVGLPKRATPVGVPQVEVEVVEEAHLAGPLHMRMRHMLLALGLPRPPYPGLFLSDPDQPPPPVAPPPRGRLDQRPRDLPLVLPPRAPRQRDRD